MNEKERIIELVKQNVISMEEALDLLEAAANNEAVSVQESYDETYTTQEDIPAQEQESERTERSFDADLNEVVGNVVNTSKDLAKNITEYFNKNYAKQDQPDADVEVSEEEKPTEPSEEEKQAAAQQIVEIDQRIAEINSEFDKRSEMLLISKQRLREIEIFAELDGLTPEMEAQKLDLEQKKAEQEDKIAQLQAEKTELQQQKEALGWKKSSHKTDDFKAFFNESSERFSEAATQFGKEASREGKKLGRFITDQSKSFVENFNLKDVNLSFQVPWVKTVVENYQLTYVMTDINRLEVEIYNGSVELLPHEGEELLIDAQVKFHGNHDEISQARFEELSTITSQDGKFSFKINSAKISVDASMKVPRRDYETIRVNLLNGDVKVNDLTTNHIIIKNKNGDMHLNNVKAHDSEFDLLNGDIIVSNSPIDALVMKNLNGDIRVDGYVNNLSADSINSNLYLSKRDASEANLKIKTVSGDIKLSLPKELNIDVNAKTSNGSVLSRLTNLNVHETHNNQKQAEYQRIASTEANTITAELSSTTGNIYLKDSQVIL